MHIRPFSHADIPECGTILVEAFWDNPLMKYRMVYREQYPIAYRTAAVQRLQTNLNNGYAFGFVCVADADDDVCKGGNASSGTKGVMPGSVLGYMWVARRAPDLNVDEWTAGRKSGMFWRLERRLRSLEKWYEDKICPNQALDTEKMRVLIDIVGGMKPFKAIDDEGMPYWYVQALAVRPDCQGKGVGRKMLSTGLEWATEEARKMQERGEIEGQNGVGRRGRVFVLLSSTSGRWLYEKMGFRVVGNEDEPTVIRVPGLGHVDWAMVWDPDGVWTMERENGSRQDEVYPTLKTWVKWKENTEFARNDNKPFIP